MTKKNIKKAAIIGAAALLLAGVAFVLAYQTDSENAPNTFTIGTDVNKPHEEFEPPDENSWYKKAVRIDNVGKVDDYIRVYLDFSNGQVKDRSLVSPQIRSYGNDAEPTEWYSMSTLTGTHEIDGTAYESYFENLPEHWVYIPETDPEDGELLGGYFYYTLPVKPGENTNWLMGTVKTTFKEGEEKIPYDIYVYAESVQVIDKDGNYFVDGITKLETPEEKARFYSDETGYLKAWREFLSRK